jgi:uncharacterized protein YabE (DUF348 family)
MKDRLYKARTSLHAQGKRHIHQRPYLLPALGFMLAVIFIILIVWAHGGQTKTDYNHHVVYLFDKGKQRTLDTKAKTVGDLLDKLPDLNLIPQDVVEPSRDTQIVEDNFRVNVYRARPVTVIDNSNRTMTLTAQRSARIVAQNAGLNVYPEDYVNFAQGSLKENIIGEKVVVDPATPISLNLYGTSLTVRSHTKTVADLLAEKRIKLAATDHVQPDLLTPVSANMQVFVLRKGTQIATVEEDIPPPVKTVDDASLSFGARVVRQPGQAGKRVVTYQINMVNGKEASRTVIQEAVVQDPVPQLVAVGTVVAVSGSHESWMAGAGISSGDFGYVNYIVSRESGWRPNALNGGGCAGLGQACPGSKLAAACPGWQNDPVCQLRFFSGYAGKYGGWAGAYNFWVSHHWW